MIQEIIEKLPEEMNLIEKIEALPQCEEIFTEATYGVERFQEIHVTTDDLKALVAQLSAANELEWLVGQMEYVQLQGDILIDVKDGEGFVVILNPDDDNRDVVGAFDTMSEAIQALKEIK